MCFSKERDSDEEVATIAPGCQEASKLSVSLKKSPAETASPPSNEEATPRAAPLKIDLASQEDTGCVPADAPVFQGKLLTGESSQRAGGAAPEASTKEEIDTNDKFNLYMSVTGMFDSSSSSQKPTGEEITPQASKSADEAKPTEASKVEKVTTEAESNTDKASRPEEPEGFLSQITPDLNSWIPGWSQLFGEESGNSTSMQIAQESAK